MKPEKMKNLFLSQSYEDAWTDYVKSLKKRYFIHWDYVILTASNEDQAKAFEAQIDFRLKQGLLPKPILMSFIPAPYSRFWICSRIFSISAFISTTVLAIWKSLALEPMVLVSRFISCTKKSSLRPMATGLLSI